MAKIWEESKGYNIARFYVDLCTITGFRSVKIFGKEKIPTDGCVLLAPNHSAALMDPLLVLLINNKPIGFGARADIFRKPLIAKFLRWIRIVPLARERETEEQASLKTSALLKRSSTASITMYHSACLQKAHTTAREACFLLKRVSSASPNSHTTS